MPRQTLWFDRLVWTGPLSIAQRLNLRLHRIFLALLFLVAVLACCGPMLDHVDLGWHVAQGRWMVHHLAFYRADALNYPTAGRPVVDEYPLYQVALYLATLPGWWGPCVLAALGYVLLFAILVLTGRALDLGPSATFSLILGILLLYFNLAFPLRPHLVTFLGIAAFGSFLLRHREAALWTRFWPLALVQVVWTNCHSGFVLGPLLVAGFGLEMIGRRWLRNREFPWTSVRIWSAATLLVFLGCFVNPWGVLRFGAPFYQEHLEAIRAYVGEMQPLSPGVAASYHHITLAAVLLVVYIVLLRRGAVSWSFLVFAFAFYLEAAQVRKAWPVFAMFLPLLVLSSAAFARTTITRRRSIAWFSVAGHVVVLVGLVLAVMTFFDGKSDDSLAVKWREWDRGRTELPVAATAWIRQNHVTGRILHRCEDGGWLQQNGIVPTWADTGFGKYDEAFIRETGLIGMQPGLLYEFVEAYQPDLILCDGFAFEWPVALHSLNYRLIFYSPNSSVWATSGSAPQRPAVTAPQVERIFAADLRQNGLPRQMALYGRSVVALSSMADPEFAIQQLTRLPPDMHQAEWYWEAVRLICFPAAVGPTIFDSYRPLRRDLARRLYPEADAVGDPSLDFRVAEKIDAHDFAGAIDLLALHGVNRLSDVEATLLLRAEMATDFHRPDLPDALTLARRQKLFDLSNAEHWWRLAVLENAAGNSAAAARAWRQAVYYDPAPDILRMATDFFQAHPDHPLDAKLLEIGGRSLDVMPQLPAAH